MVEVVSLVAGYVAVFFTTLPLAIAADFAAPRTRRPATWYRVGDWLMGAAVVAGLLALILQIGDAA